MTLKIRWSLQAENTGPKVVPSACKPAVTQRPGHYSIIEEYVDADAAETHNNHVDSLLRELFAVADLVSVSFYGELNQYLREWISGREGIAVNLPL